MSLGFLRIEPMRYTKYIQQCLAVLEQEREYDTDMRLVTLVRVLALLGVSINIKSGLLRKRIGEGDGHR